MNRQHVLIAGMLLLSVAVAGASLWQRRPKEVWEGRPVHPTSPWQQRIQEWLAASAAAEDLFDRVEIHAISPELFRLDPHDSGTVGLGDWKSSDLAQEKEHRRVLGRRAREQSSQRLFPTDPSSTPHHVILASRMLQGAEAQQLLSLWQAQTLDCEPREGISLCHGPNFALSIYAGDVRAVEVELCWSCQEASFSTRDNRRLSCDFGVDTQAAAALRRLLRRHFPSVRVEEDLAPSYFHDWR